MAYLVGALVFCPLISALAFSAPAVTPCGGFHAKIAAPEPTKAPELELLKRQDVQLSLIEGPDEVCGYQYGALTGALEICGTSICGFATAMGEVGEIYCYGPTTSEPRPLWTSCLGGTLAYSCLGDSACSNNPGIIKCTAATESHCNVGTFVGLGVEAVWCDSTYYTGMIPISTTYVGQVGRELTPVLASSSSTVPPIILTNPLSTPVTSLSKSIPTPTPTPTPSPTPTPVPSHSTPVGAIVGGVIGGLALIAAVIAGIFICLRIKRKDEQAHQAGPPAPVQTSHEPANPQYPSEKYPATAGATFMPASTAFPPQQTKPEEHYQYQQPPQPQYQQQAHAPYPQTPNMAPAQTWQPPPQQYPGAYVDQNGAPQHPIQPYPPQDYKPQSPPPSARPQSLSSDALGPQHTGRESISGTSSPGSPAPPYPSSFPSVPEMNAEMSHHAYPLGDEPSEMPT